MKERDDSLGCMGLRAARSSGRYGAMNCIGVSSVAGPRNPTATLAFWRLPDRSYPSFELAGTCGDLATALRQVADILDHHARDLAETE